jgi:hypothetical protein
MVIIACAGDLVIDNPVDANTHDHRPTGRRETGELTSVGTSCGSSGHYPVAFGDLVFNRELHVRESTAIEPDQRKRIWVDGIRINYTARVKRRGGAQFPSHFYVFRQHQAECDGLHTV